MSVQMVAARDRFLVVSVVLLYVAVIALGAQFSRGYFVLFPGLVAVAYEVLMRPWGRWASQRWRLIATPALAAAIGTAITLACRYSVMSVLLDVVLCLLVLVVFRANISAAMPAGLLPLVLEIKTWWYPVSVAVGLVVLVCVLVPWQRRCRQRYQEIGQDAANGAETLSDAPAFGRPGLWMFVLFIALMALCAGASGLRLILFPPLIVLTYEMFLRPTSCPWASRPGALIAACSLTALGGWVAVSLLDASAIAAVCAAGFGILVLRALQIHVPPALTVGILPGLITSPGIGYPISVMVGTAALCLAFLLCRPWLIAASGSRTKSFSDMRSAQCQIPN
ncbi:hypothetical protein [Mycolicibacter icosiumassiliensis]|uniref:hypothetical protein n=1 Tax=Mycolicibacter icosiumassiliensis TaxID=1792835 RepID=UPI000AC3D7DC|nr:hypothetical protein [Mycolicibacter icosiumassiliensis]